MTNYERPTVRPTLTFACELEPERLAVLVDTPGVIEHLLALDATVSLGLLDLGPERAKIVRRLNDAGVPLVAWLLLPKEEGYWFHAGNVAQATARYDAFERWTAEHGLRWTGVGFDVEPDYREMRHIAAGRAWRLLPRIVGRWFTAKKAARAESAYAGLVARAKEAGYRTESYQIPFVVDDRRAGARTVHRALRLVDLPVEREILMLYTSMVRRIGPGMLWSYGPDAGGIGVGSTGGGVEMPGEPPPLTWEELARDLRLARAWTDEVFVFSLEGCVEHGFLDRIVDFDWGVAVEPPLEEAARVDRLRQVARGLLLVTRQGRWAGAALVVVLWLLTRR
jgi:hypothetical protein